MSKIDVHNIGTSKGRIFIATGASGGHIFPGLGIAVELRKKGYNCTFIGAGRQFTKLVEDEGFNFITLPASQFNVRGIKAKLFSLVRMARAVLFSLQLFVKQRPVAVLGMGSYASVAAVFAAWLLRIPSLIHEQNAKPGRANLFLAHFVGCLMLTFEGVKQKFPKKVVHKCKAVGSPIRAEVLAYRGVARPKSGGLNIFVLGGSQGSSVMAEVVPKAIAGLPKTLQKQLCVTQQARADDVDAVKALYANLTLKSLEICPFFDDLPKLLHQADLVITRAGTGILLEIATLGRAAIVIPHELADGHQVENARVLNEVGGIVMVREKGLEIKTLTAELQTLLEDEKKRTHLEENIVHIAKPNAAAEAVDTLLNFALPNRA